MFSKIFDGPFFVYHDTDKENRTSEHNLTREEADSFNHAGFAVAVYVNDLAGGRSNKDCVRIRAWFTDIDYKDKPKPELDEVLDLSPLLPSVVVETKNGYHLYFAAVGCPVGEHYKEQQKAICDWFKGDPKCANMARGLRAPGFYHMKGEPFMVEVVWQLDVSYTPDQIDFSFPKAVDEDMEDAVFVDFHQRHKKPAGNNIFDQIYAADASQILAALSGTAAVEFKQYKFHPQSNGHKNIIVDGKDSGCFINAAGKVIGDPEYSGGAVEWLRYYGHTRSEAAKIIAEVMGWEYKL